MSSCRGSAAAVGPPGSRAHHTGAALLQLLGWVGFLGIGYLLRGRVGMGLVMLVGWWLAFWFLLFASVITFGLLHPLMLVAWIIVPPLTAYFAYSE